MGSTARKSSLAAVLATAAVAVTIGSPAASARPIDLGTPPATHGGLTSAVPPPPSSIAASAAKEYSRLRAAGAQDSARPAASQPGAREPSAPGGFDWVSGMIGGAAAAALSLVSFAFVGVRRPPRRRPASA
jgi:hypothetical protein